ncbi:hypothetical protein, partial [Sphingopyxis sp. Geo48]|uniref:hypothetical protein n=1 Tax=Sphingopyxis sp. Geo48 TaxID=545241 RepID=UPI0024B6771E
WGDSFPPHLRRPPPIWTRWQETTDCGHVWSRYDVDMEILIVDLARTAIERVDDRHGRAAAWVVAIVSISILIGIPVSIVLYLIS